MSNQQVSSIKKECRFVKQKNRNFELHELDVASSTDSETQDDYESASDSSGSIGKRPLHASTISKFNKQNRKVNNQLENVMEPANLLEFVDMRMNSTKNNAELVNLCKEIWRNADAVCFDVDSTVCCDEAIDELAKYVGKAKEVADITKTAMAGAASFRDALARRLEIIQPSREVIAQYLATHKPRLTEHIKELVSRLHQLGVDVYLISGGFDVIIQPTAELLKIPMSNVFANSIKFFYDGSYAGFEKSRPTSNQNGKSHVVGLLKQTKGYKNVVMIGDGVTDLEACPPADAFIGFGGNVIRDSVRNNSYWYVYNFKELIAELPYCNRNLHSI